VSLINLAGAVLVAATGTAAPPAHKHVTARHGAPQHARSAKIETQPTIKIRTDGNTTRPPLSEAEQTRLALEAFLARVTQTYASLPDEEDRLPDQPKRDLDAPKADEPHS
jgi:hypothetical protein